MSRWRQEARVIGLLLAAVVALAVLVGVISLLPEWASWVVLAVCGFTIWRSARKDAGL